VGSLLRHCVEVCTVIELSFRVVSGVGPGIHVLDGRSMYPKGKGLLLAWFLAFFGIFAVFISMGKVTSEMSTHV